MNSLSSKLARHVAPFVGGVLAVETCLTGRSEATNSKGRERTFAWGWLNPLLLPTVSMESSKAYEHDPSDFDYYVPHPTVDDLPVLLHKFDQENQEVWPWVWTHPNENGPHHVFLGNTMTPELVKRIQELRRESPQNNILILIADEDESSLRYAAEQAGTDVSVYDQCHCGIVTGVKLQLLHAQEKILMLDDERVIAFDYLTIC